MARLPTVGGDSGSWGSVLNTYLSVEHNGDGTHPTASSSAKGMVTLASGTDVSAGTSSTKAVVPSTLYTTQTLTDGATISWDVSQGTVATVTLGGNRTLNNPTNLIAGASYIVVVKQDGTGNRTLTWGTNYKFPDGFKPVLSTAASAVDLIAFISDGTVLYGSFQGNFS